MSILNKSVPFPNSIFGRFLLSVVITLVGLFLIFLYSSWQGFDPAVGGICNAGGIRSLDCGFFEDFFFSFMFLVWLAGLSGGIVLLPLFIPILVVWIVIEVMYRLSQLRKV